jgi:hypothetical protein
LHKDANKRCSFIKLGSASVDTHEMTLSQERC